MIEKRAGKQTGAKKTSAEGEQMFTIQTFKRKLRSLVEK